MIYHQSIWSVFSSLAHPSYLMVNAVILGRIECLDKDCIPARTYLASFGVGSSSIGIVLLASSLTFTAALS